VDVASRGSQGGGSVWKGVRKGAKGKERHRLRQGVGGGRTDDEGKGTYLIEGPLPPFGRGMEREGGGGVRGGEARGGRRRRGGG
jgi:hypothetical protein